MLSVEDLRVSYGGTVHALRGVTLDVRDQAVVAVLGANGAGKTTLLRAISGILHLEGGAVTGGRITMDGQDLRRLSSDRIVRSGVVHVPEGRRIFSGLTVDENLKAGAFTAGRRSGHGKALERVFDLFPILKTRHQQLAGQMSGGEQQMLAIGRALMADPKVLLLDEPSLGLAPLIVERIGRIVADINAQGTTVMLIEQNAAMALSIASEAFVLTNGEVTLSGPAEEMAHNEEIKELYLGHGDSSGATTRTRADRPRLEKWAG